MIEEKLGRAIAILKKQSHIPSLVARRDGESIKEMKILAVSKALEVVVLNAGSEDGVRLGSTWILKQSEGDEKVTLNIVEVRRKICAAIVKEGQFSQVKIGDVTITGK